MTSISTNLASNMTPNELESPHISSFIEASPLSGHKRLMKSVYSNRDENPPEFVSFLRENSSPANGEPSPSEKLILPRRSTLQEDGSPRRRRFWSYSESLDNKTESDYGQIPLGHHITFQAETDSLDLKAEGSELPNFQGRSGSRRHTSQSLKSSRFRRQSIELQGTATERNESEISTTTRNSLLGNEEKKRKGLASTAHTLLKKTSIFSSSKFSMTFDAFVDKRKGEESIKSNYPTYKTDKRLIFLGQKFKYPALLIPYKSNFRKIWNMFIIALILYQVFWYPLAASFLYNQDPPSGIIIFEWVLMGIFIADIIVNFRTTYCNANNEEIIDATMIRKNYIKKIDFIFDIITLIPLSEILFYSFHKYDERHLLYSIPKLLRFLRLLKLTKYQRSITYNSLTKIIRIFIGFFLMVHFASCLWFLLIKAQYYQTDDTERIWFPNNMRMIVDGSEALFRYYEGMDVPEVYAYTMLAVFMLVVGSDMAPVNQTQVYFTVVIGLLGAISLAYVFGLITYIINRRNESHSEYQQKLEALTQKLQANKIPENLKMKVLEYFSYTWQKHKVLHKLNDFSELSIPLQRDLAFYQNQKLVTKVPLFQELEPLEVLSVIQNLKTCVYMPGDKIIREGERGSEMYFIQEGVVEIVIKTANSNPTQPQTPSFHKIYLEKESYFGEIALMSNSKRTSDVNAYEFCILESFSRADYNNLKKEFPDIGPRLKSGLKYYKSNRRDKIMGILKGLPIFEGFTEEELKTVIDEYTEEVFVDPDKIILKPKERINAVYFVFLGNVNCYADNSDTKEYLLQFKKVGQTEKPAIAGPEEEFELECLDDKILDLEKDKTSIDDKKKKLKLIKAYPYGGYFGSLDFGENEVSCEHYFVSDTGCQLGAITQELLEDLSQEHPELFEKLKDNVIKCSPKKAMGSIEEEGESIVSVSMRNGSPTRLGLKRMRTSLTSSRADGPRISTSLIHHSSISHMEEEFVHFKEQLGKTQGDVDSIKHILVDISSKLATLVAQNEQSNSPNRRTSSFKSDTRPRSLHPKSKSNQTYDNLAKFEVQSFPYIEEAFEDSEKSP